MAGFKEAILNFEPVLFLTFDSDLYDPLHRTLLGDPQVFVDETEFANHGLLHVDSNTYHGYRMGLPSIVNLEQTDQRSISFGWYGPQLASPNRWPKAFIEVPHQDQYAFDQEEPNFGSFAVNLMVMKASDEDQWRSTEMNHGGPWTATLIRPLIRKENVFYIYYEDRYASSDRFIVQIPGNETMVMDVPSWFYGQDNMLTLTWKVVEVNPGIYEGTATFYINGHIYLTNTRTFYDTFPPTNIATPIEIAGLIANGGTTHSDKMTSNTQFDQIALFPFSFSPDEVAFLYKKTRSYDNIMMTAQPRAYWPMTDAESATIVNMVDMSGYNNGVYLGGTSRVLREKSPPWNLVAGSSVQFLNGGCAAVHRLGSIGNGYTPVFNPANDFSIMFWVSFENADRSVLFSLQSDDYPYRGVLCEANRRFGGYHPGGIDFSLGDDVYLPSLTTKPDGSAYFFNDGVFHLIHMIKKNGVIELWIDGIKHGQKSVVSAPVTAPGPGQIYLMGAAPGKLSTMGNMSSVAIFNYAFDPQEIRMHYHYPLIYRIKGTVTLQGNPHQANVRAYRFLDGSLIREVLSDPNTGEYECTLYDNSLVDLMVLNKQDRNIRYRAYGPITPVGYEDYPA